MLIGKVKAGENEEPVSSLGSHACVRLHIHALSGRTPLLDMRFY